MVRFLSANLLTASSPCFHAHVLFCFLSLAVDMSPCRCEYIFYRGLYRTSYARVSRGIVTDTELQIGQFVVPRPGVVVSDDSKDARYMRAFKEELPTEHVSARYWDYTRVVLSPPLRSLPAGTVVPDGVLPRARREERA